MERRGVLEKGPPACPEYQVRRGGWDGQFPRELGCP